MDSKILDVFLKALNNSKSYNLVITGNIPFIFHELKNSLLASLYMFDINHSSSMLKLSNGSVIIFSTGSTPDHLRGRRFDCVYIDEFNKIRDIEYVLHSIINPSRLENCIVGEVV